jgi:hypothetical protein
MELQYTMWDDSTKRRLKAEPSLRKTIFDFDLPAVNHNQCTLLVLIDFCPVFSAKHLHFEQTYLNTGSKTQKCGRVKPRSDIP